MSEKKVVVEFTEEQIESLRLYILITENYRKGEIEACESISQMLDEKGEKRFPLMAGNAELWRKLDRSVTEIMDMLYKV